MSSTVNLMPLHLFRAVIGDIELVTWTGEAMWTVARIQSCSLSSLQWRLSLRWLGNATVPFKSWRAFPCTSRNARPLSTKFTERARA